MHDGGRAEFANNVYCLLKSVRQRTGDGEEYLERLENRVQASEENVGKLFVFYINFEEGKLVSSYNDLRNKGL